MKKIDEILIILQSLIGEETLLRELEGICTKHQGLSRRTRKPGRVALCAHQIREYREGGGRVDPVYLADCVAAWSLSQASVYRLLCQLRTYGIHVRPVEILRRKEQKNSGIY